MLAVITSVIEQLVQGDAQVALPEPALDDRRLGSLAGWTCLFRV